MKTVTDEDRGHGLADEIPLAIVTDNNAPQKRNNRLNATRRDSLFVKFFMELWTQMT